MEKDKRSRMEADYSWLAMSPTSSDPRRPYEMPEMRRIELEQLCSRLHPSDCGAVILSFRRAVDDQQPTSAEMVPTMLRSVICTVRHASSCFRQQPPTTAKDVLKPNSIRLSGSKLVGDQLRTSSEPASVMEFGFYQT